MTTTDPQPPQATSPLAETARLLGVLLQCELDAPLVARLRETGVFRILAELGLHLPAADDDAAFDDLAASYFETFVSPRSGHPPIQSLAEGGSYDGPSCRAVGEIAEQLGLSRDVDRAMGAPPDHLGSELELWAEIVDRAPARAGDFVHAHLAWAIPSMRRRAGETGFYARLSGIVAEFIESAMDQGTGHDRDA